jgi:aryl-alcohol dehydrogenase-like predicted oxidoreductase
VAETVAAMKKFQQEGKIRWIGLSNCNADQIAEATEVAGINALQIQYSLLDRAKVDPVVEPCRRAGISLATWGSLSQGLLTGKFSLKTEFDAGDRRGRYPNFQGDNYRRALKLVEKVCEVARDIGKTPAQVSLRWLLDRSEVATVLCGAKRPRQLTDNLGALNWSLPAEARAVLDSSSMDLVQSAQKTMSTA